MALTKELAKTSKRILTLALNALVLSMLLLMGLMLGACGGPQGGSGGAGSGTGGAEAGNGAGNGERIQIVTTIFPAYDFSRQIAGDKAEVSLLLPPGVESHSFEPTPSDIISIQNCDVFIYVGGESDVWVDEILASLDNSDLQTIRLMDCVSLVPEEVIEGMEDEEEEAASEGSAGAEEEEELDEHVWTSPRNAKLITQAISDVLCEIDPGNAEFYETQTVSYLGQLDELDAQFRDVVATATRNTLVFGDRFPFRYFVDEYGLDYYAAFPGCSSDSEASPQTVAFLIDKVKSEQLPVVLKIELSNHGIADTIAQETGAQVLIFHSVHNVSLDEMNAQATYLSLMEANVQVLREALN
jgi:zinc transport system substrate-binding protein